MVRKAGQGPEQGRHNRDRENKERVDQIACHAAQKDQHHRAAVRCADAAHGKRGQKEQVQRKPDKARAGRDRQEIVMRDPETGVFVVPVTSLKP